ncbi:hypothetical protein EXV95_10550 [Acidovorax sp. JMULE5]|uniref:hypothetical protein n=1 Tax=Acidovorax sp. JMULE5 TaxID=2518343 RepID=UPI0015A3FE4C|nr:hypothetical protein [Acidovorax sp. JMULE5]QLA81035.1 hypothetical protein EXV95_10550 [Acidovorax sp. JMULE5]
MDLSLTFHDNKTGHRDIVLRFAGQEWICDSYYLAIDTELLPEVEDEGKIRAVLRRLHEQWLEAIEGLKVGEVAYLPFDFSDQCTGWLRCTAKSTGYSIFRPMHWLVALYRQVDWLFDRSRLVERRRLVFLSVGNRSSSAQSRGLSR